MLKKKVSDYAKTQMTLGLTGVGLSAIAPLDTYGVTGKIGKGIGTASNIVTAGFAVDVLSSWKKKKR